MKKIFKTAAAAVTAMMMASAAGAVTLATYTHDYGSGAGKVDPGGNDVLTADSVIVSDQSTGRFSDSFDFTGLAYDTIDSFSLELTFEDAGPRGFLGWREAWTARIQGSDNGSSADDFFAVLFDDQSPQSIVMTLASDTGGVDAFAHTVASGVFEFWFSEFTTFADAFALDSATLTINGTAPAPVPLPAGMPLLLAGLGGLALARRRKQG